MMPRSFDEFTQAEQIKQPALSAKAWFDAHPGLLDQVVAAREDDWSWDTILHWLQAEHGCKLKSPSSLRRALNISS